MSERPMVNVYEEDERGVEQLVYRPMNDAELAQRELDQAEAAELVLSKSPLEQLADHLETLEPGAPVSASDLLAILRPDTMTADAPAPSDHPAAGA